MLKVRRSVLLPMTFLATTVAALVAGLFMFIVRHPAQAERLGLLRQKANLSGLSGDWDGLLDFLAQVVSVGDLLLFAFVFAWVFGREAADGTQRYLLALPVSRSVIVLAKFTVVGLWALATNLWLAAAVVTMGTVLALPGGDADTIWQGLLVAGSAAALMLIVSTPAALVASAGRGYLTALGAAVAALLVAQVAGVLGWAAVVPWSVPAVAAGIAPDAVLSPPSLVVAAVTGIAGVVGTLAWWRGGRADG
jgi:ABC-2 type transport system permease protein